jgi:hypothetical protein
MQSAETMLRGLVPVLVLVLFDVCEAIRLDRLQELIRARTVEQLSRCTRIGPSALSVQLEPKAPARMTASVHRVRRA